MIFVSADFSAFTGEMGDLLKLYLATSLSVQHSLNSLEVLRDKLFSVFILRHASIQKAVKPS